MVARLGARARERAARIGGAPRVLCAAALRERARSHAGAHPLPRARAP